VFSYDTAILKLVRPTFTGDACGGRPPCGSGCACGGADARKCEGCTCTKHPTNGFYCDSTPGTHTLKADDRAAFDL